MKAPSSITRVFLFVAFGLNGILLTAQPLSSTEVQAYATKLHDLEFLSEKGVTGLVQNWKMGPNLPGLDLD